MVCKNATSGLQFWGAAVLTLALCMAGNTGGAQDVFPSSKPGDAVVSINGTLSLDQAIGLALAGNPELAATAWDAAVAEEKLAGAEAARWPILSAEAGYQHHLDDQRLMAASYNGESGVFDDDIFRADLVLKIPLYSGGKITSDIEAAELLHLAETKRLARTREELVFNVTSTFHALLGQGAVIRAVEESIAVMEAHIARLKALEAMHKVAPVDVMRTEVRLAGLRQALVREANALAVGKRLLASLLGASDAGWTLDGVASTPDSPTSSVDTLVTMALEKRADYLAAQDRLAAQEKKIDAARSGKLPVVALAGAYGGRMTETSESADVGSVGIGLSLPLFDGGRVDAQIRQERAVLAAARDRLRKLELQIRQDVETALLSLDVSIRQLAVGRQSVALAEEALRIERLKYEMGRGTALDVLDTQAALLQAQTDVARTMADSNISRAKLTLATGEQFR
ncbi:MAG: TolC family protein [Opitutae bacterium]|nr:TolC family protein [Opitutae bacterium]